MLTCRSERFPRLGEMNRPNRFGAVAVLQVLRQQRFNRCRVEVLEKSINDAAQHPLRKTFGGRIDRRDPAKMDRLLLAVSIHSDSGWFMQIRFSRGRRLPEKTRCCPGVFIFWFVCRLNQPPESRALNAVCFGF